MNNFNWENYIQNYPDLKHINTKLGAWRHYQRFGKSENRTDEHVNRTICFGKSENCTDQYINGINNIDIVYFINLKHRTDRFESITTELKNINLNPDKIHSFNAIYNPEQGISGCTLSHCAVLELFINSNLENCIIFEDDFKFTQNSDIVKSMFNSFFNSTYFNDYDILMLAGSTKTEEIIEPYLTKVYHSQTTSGYSVSKKFAPILLENFKETVVLDLNWIKLQPISNWYSFYPRIGLQMEGYSDITHKNENYRL